MKLPKGAIRLSNDIEIWKIPNFATPEQCDQLIKDADKIGYQRSEVDSKKEAKTQSRTSSTSFITHDKTQTGKILGNKAKDIVNYGLDKESINSLEGIQIQRYYKDQKYNPHYDTFEHKDGSDQRSWTLMIYLNNVEEGGSTFFTKLGLKLKPEKGTAILWNNLDSNNCRENKTLHMGEPVINGVKYIATYWFRKSGNQSTMCPQLDDQKFNMKFQNPEVKEQTFSFYQYICIISGFIILVFLFLVIFNLVYI